MGTILVLASRQSPAPSYRGRQPYKEPEALGGRSRAYVIACAPPKHMTTPCSTTHLPRLCECTTNFRLTCAASPYERIHLTSLAKPVLGKVAQLLYFRHDVP